MTIKIVVNKMTKPGGLNSHTGYVYKTIFITKIVLLSQLLSYNSNSTTVLAESFFS